MSRNHNKYVRFYFRLDLKCLIPPNPASSGKTSKQWEREQIESLESDLQDLMQKSGFDLAYEAHCCEDVAHRLFSVLFIVAVLCEIQPSQIASIEKSCGTFRIRERSLCKILRGIESKALEILSRRPYLVAKFDYLDSTCRDFTFEIYLGGNLEVEYSLSKKDIDDAGGIREAIDYFNSQVIDCCEAANITAQPKGSPLRRPTNNVFKYELTAEEHYCFPENAVLGNLALLRKNITLQKAMEAMIDCDNQTMIDYIAGTRQYFECNQLLDLPNKAILRKLTLDFVDYDGDIFDINDMMP